MNKILSLYQETITYHKAGFLNNVNMLIINNVCIYICNNVTLKQMQYRFAVNFGTLSRI